MINLNKNLILIKNEDKTENIETWRYSNGYYFITFCDGNTYKYNFQNVKFYKDPEEIDLANVMVQKNGNTIYYLKQVLVFQYHSKIIYLNGYKETVENNALRFVCSVLSMPKSKETFDYLKQVANTVGISGEDGNNILSNRYKKLDFIREDCALSNYLTGNINVVTENQRQIIYPFGFNISQKQAVKNAMIHRLSVIEGPPGTGKTQTILNIIANAIMSGQSVAVVSSNNSATQNVYDKLDKYGIGFIAAYLGNGFNKKEFIENQVSNIPNLDDWYLEQENYDQIKNELLTMSQQLDSMLEIKNDVSNLIQLHDTIKLEYEHYMNYYNETNYDDREIVLNAKMNSDRLIKLLVSLENEEERKNSIWNFIYDLYKYGIRNHKFFKNSQDRKLAICQKLFYELKLREISAEIEKKNNILKGYNFNENMSIYSEKSMRLLKASIVNKYKRKSSRVIYTLDDLWKHSEQFIEDYPIILSTTYSLISSLSSQFIYDYVIVDEASQVDLATGALALSCAKKAVIVGDLKQLPNVINSSMKQKTDFLFNNYDLNEAYRYAGNSLLSSVCKLFQNIPHTLLREHYRCHPKIIQFCNQKFYNNELIILTQNTDEPSPLMVYRTVEGNHKRGNVNVRQVDVIEKEVIPQLNLDVAKDSIGIVTPYRNQTEYLQQLFNDTTVKADTVDKFQGQECDTIILSTVDDEISDFSDDPNRLNVAISRAKKQLIVVTDGNNSQKQSNLRDLVEYIEYNNYSVVDSKIYSIFDYLYKAYNEVRIMYLQNRKKVSAYDSENLMFSLIQEVLDSEHEFDSLDVAIHVPLRMIIRDLKLLDEAAIRYVMASGTHVDFVIYSKISKKLILVIEVDGYSFHKEGTRQAERDKLKNTILDTYEIPYVRFVTNESGEKDKLTNILMELLKKR
jgi:superfamily I DNA and/or RNA helicase